MFGNVSSVEQKEKDRRFRNRKREALLYIFLFLCFFPVLPIGLAGLFGVVLALVESAPYMDCFLYVISNLLGFANPLTAFSPDDGIAIVVDIYVSTVAIMLFGIVLNIITIFEIPYIINDGIRIFADGSFTVPFIALAFVIPALAMSLSTGFGIILAVLENWTLKDGILYVTGNLLQLGNPLTTQMPTTIRGDLIDIFVSSMALGTTAVFIDYVTILNPARFIRKKVQRMMFPDEKAAESSTADSSSVVLGEYSEKMPYEVQHIDGPIEVECIDV